MDEAGGSAPEAVNKVEGIPGAGEPTQEKLHLNPGGIHAHGLKFLKRNYFDIGQAVDLTYLKEVPRFFAMDTDKKRFYYDPSPPKMPIARLIFRIHRVDRILGASIYEREKVTEEKNKNGIFVLRERTLGVQISMNDPSLSMLQIQCMPYAAVGNSEYLGRYRLANIILDMLGDAAHFCTN